MQLSASSSVDEVAAIVSDALTSAGITAVLSGGAAVQIYTSGLYELRDLDFVASASQRELEQVLNRLGFTREAGRHFVHPTCPYTLNFLVASGGRQRARSRVGRATGWCAANSDPDTTQCVMAGLRRSTIGATGRDSTRRSW